MPVKKKNTCKKKFVNKQIKSNPLPVQVGQKASRNEKKTTLPKNAAQSKNTDNSGVRRTHSPFNRFANNSTRIVSRINNNMSPQSTYRPSGLSSKEKSYVICSCQQRSTRYLVLKKLAMKAIQEHKIFTVYGNCNAVRKALLERGWVEKIPSNRMNLAKIRNGSLSTQPEINGELERLLLSSLVEKYPPNFIWRTKDAICDHSIDMTKECITIENKLRTDTLWTSKQGLCLSVKRNYWFYIEDVSEVISPRSYNTYDTDDIDEFVKDYKMTACTSLLKWLLSMIANDKPAFTKSGGISLNVLVFALNRCKEYLFRKENKDIDRNMKIISTGQWNTFLKKYYRLIGKEDVFQVDTENKLPLYLDYARFLLKQIYRYRQQLSCEGIHNIWIIKPAHNSRGRGIRMASKLGVITNLLYKANAKYVIQKYIEEPLLIHDTKFDIRQYYLVTSTYPLEIWMYKDCYLKFSSQKYNLTNYHESIHLTNNAVQKKYKNCAGRHPELPQNNMWDSDEYKKYLNSIDKSAMWDDVIYPGMRKSIVSIMLSCQDSLAVSKNKFELYGCDFVIDKMYQPWLIEINSGPDLNHTTPVTAKICPAVVADIIKVVIDYPHDRKSSTGKFECIYRQSMTVPRYGPAADLIVRGFALPSSYFYKGDIPIQKAFHDDIQIEEEDNSEALMGKINQYNMNAITVSQEDCSNDTVKDEEECESPCKQTSQLEYELSMATKVITIQLEDLMDRIISDNHDTIKLTPRSHTHGTLLKTESVRNVAKDVSVIMKPMTRPSTEVITLIPKQCSSKFQFSKLDDDPSGKGSVIGVGSIKKIFHDFSQISSLREKITPKITNSSDPNNVPTSKNIIREATSEIFNFIIKKQREYLS